MKKGEIHSIIKSVDSVFENYPKAVIKEQHRKIVQNGNQLQFDMLDASVQDCCAENIRVYDREGIFYGVYGYESEKAAFVPRKMFFCQVEKKDVIG